VAEGCCGNDPHIHKGTGNVKLAINATFLNEKPTGAASFAKEVSPVLSRLCEGMVFFSPVECRGVPPDSIVRVPDGVRGSTRLSNNLYRFLYINAVLPVLCRRKKIDVLYCPILEFPFIPLVPAVVHIHDLHFIHFPSEFGLAAPRMKLSLRLVNRSVRRTVVSSEFIKGELLRSTMITEEMIDVVPLAYNSTLFKPVPSEEKEDFLKRYRIRGKYILFIGSLFPYKNLETLEEAFGKIKDRIPHSLVVVGRREFALEERREDRRILYADYVPAEDLPFFYSCADLFVYPSLREGFGIPPLEAMACGTPVISSYGGSLPEVVGEAGILFDPLDSSLLAEMILKVLDDEPLRRQLIEKGFSRIMKFSWERTAAGILRSCEKALRKTE